jgi:hypothetical protein
VALWPKGLGAHQCDHEVPLGHLPSKLICWPKTCPAAGDGLYIIHVTTRYPSSWQSWTTGTTSSIRFVAAFLKNTSTRAHWWCSFIIKLGRRFLYCVANWLLTSDQGRQGRGQRVNSFSAFAVAVAFVFSQPLRCPSGEIEKNFFFFSTRGLTVLGKVTMPRHESHGIKAKNVYYDLVQTYTVYTTHVRPQLCRP